MFSDNDDDGHDYDDEVPGATGSTLSLLRRKTKRIKENKDWFVIQVFFTNSLNKLGSFSAFVRTLNHHHTDT